MLFQVLFQKSYQPCRQRYKEIYSPLILLIPCTLLENAFSLSAHQAAVLGNTYTHNSADLPLQKNFPLSWEPAQNPPRSFLLGCEGCETLVSKRRTCGWHHQEQSMTHIFYTSFMFLTVVKVFFSAIKISSISILLFFSIFHHTPFLKSSD